MRKSFENLDFEVLNEVCKDQHRGLLLILDQSRLTDFSAQTFETPVPSVKSAVFFGFFHYYVIDKFGVVTGGMEFEADLANERKS